MDINRDDQELSQALVHLMSISSDFLHILVQQVDSGLMFFKLHRGSQFS